MDLNIADITSALVKVHGILLVVDKIVVALMTIFPATSNGS